MRSLILFLGLAQITAAALYCFFELRGAQNAGAVVRDFGLPLQLLAAAILLGAGAMWMSRWRWMRGIALLVALILPILFIANDLGFSWS